MAQIGTTVSSLETPPAVLNSFNSANAFMVGLADWGPVGASGVSTPFTSLNQAAASFGSPNGGLIQLGRTATDATLYDSADAFFREGGGTLYVSRVLGPNPTFGSLALQDSTGGTTATLTAAYLGPGSSAINVVVANSVTTYQVTLQDAAANPLNISPVLSNANKADLISWAAGTNLVTATAGNTLLAKTIAKTPLSTGSDDHTNATITNWTTALNSGFPIALGPGQVMAPAQTNTSLAGIWSALGSHAQLNNRIALLDGTDGNTASQAVAEVTTAALPSTMLSYCGIWAGNLQIPGITSGTTRVIAPSSVVAALCSRADNLGNPNQAAAGTNFPLNYVSGVNTAYTGALIGDIVTLNTAGINVFSNQFQTLQNYGFVSAQATPTTDLIFWQLSHGRTRMAIAAAAQLVGNSYLFDQIDGQGFAISAFNSDLQAMLIGFYNAGALYGATATDAFTVNTSASINTPASLAAGNLVGLIAVRMSPFAQLVQIQVNAVSITQQLTQVAPTTVGA